MEIEVVSPIEAQAEVQRYTLVSDDIYVRRYDVTTVPLWYRSLIESLVASDPTITDINGAINYLSSLDAGYTIKFANLETQDSVLNSTLTSLVATTGGHTAAIASLDTTKVDAASASAIALSTVGTYFANGSAGAWFNTQISTYASAISANAMSLSTLSVTLDGHTAMITDISAVSIDPVTGYKLGASKIGTAPDGSITGWQFADGTGIQSSFKIMATNFSVSDGTTGYVPFSISGSNVKFNGVVDFTNTNVANGYAGTTTINGGMVTAGTISAGQIDADAINGKTIVGARIEGAVILGTIIKSSWIDYTTTGALTDWQYFTPTTIPAGYEANFAHNSIDGTLVVDSLGYVRIAGITQIFSTTAAGTYTGSYTFPFHDGIYSYASYMLSTAKRVIMSTPTVYNITKQLLFYCKFTYVNFYPGYTSYIQYSFVFCGATVVITNTVGSVSVTINGSAATLTTIDSTNQLLMVYGVPFIIEYIGNVNNYYEFHVYLGITATPVVLPVYASYDKPLMWNLTMVYGGNGWTLAPTVTAYIPSYKAY